MFSCLYRGGITIPILSRTSFFRCVHSYLPSMGHGRGRMNPTNGHYNDKDPAVEMIMRRLKKLASGALCDSDKAHQQIASTSEQPELREYAGLRLMCPSSMKLRNPIPKCYANMSVRDGGKSNVMVGIARTVQLTRPNDFLAVLYGLSQTSRHDVLVVNTGGSTRAVAGGLFSEEAARRGLSGIVVDGPIRDVDDLSPDIRVYSTMISPYAGTVQHPGDGIDVTPVICGGVVVNPGDIIFGDADGVLVGSAKTFSDCLHEAENIMSVEEHLIDGMKLGVSLHSMMNFNEHMMSRKEGKVSSLEFKDRNTIKFTGLDPIHLS
ncbi:hypothetical protein HJC23_002893 [Cyclotella cryptica]|uniref:Dimethylmenaquinone methyltransferase n=1 Tax=Cyclotella cryptica TaxID=29204 RepID=A0ABD3PJW0_9STRA|eukprot:CCRYP_014113-RA/>CCRYP_014113-RA protein AED:0.03 eAED:0.03 QI:188/1/1/1/1/1/2/135/320